MDNIREKLVEQFRWWATECDRTNFGCQASKLLVDAAKYIANNVKVQEWIPVTERLPEDMRERVLVSTDCDTPVGNQKIDTDRFRHGEWVRYGSHVTHWMPLPSSPKGE